MPKLTTCTCGACFYQYNLWYYPDGHDDKKFMDFKYYKKNYIFCPRCGDKLWQDGEVWKNES